VTAVALRPVPFEVRIADGTVEVVSAEPVGQAP